MQNSPSTFDNERKSQVREKLLLNYRQLILENLPIAVERAIKDAEVKLMLSVNESLDGALRSDFSVSLQMLETRSHWVSEQVCDSVIAALGVIAKNKMIQPDQQKEIELNNNLSVVDKHDFEDWLAMNSAIKTIEEGLGYELNRICYVFEAISDQVVGVVDCPVGPTNIIRAFQLGCNTLKIPATAFPIIYKVAGHILKAELKDIYGVLISSAERYGIKGAATQESFSRGGGTSQGTDDGELHSASISLQSDLNKAEENEIMLSETSPLMEDEVLFGQPKRKQKQGDTYSTLQTLINLKATVEGGGAVIASSDLLNTQALQDQKPSYKVQDIIDAVNQLQTVQFSEASDESNVVELPLKDVVKNRLQEIEGNDSQLGGKEDELIDITDRLFEAILGQIGISDVLKKWLKKLKLSVLKVVLLDDTFFSEHNHPARQVINQLARLAGTKRTPNRSVERSLEHFTDRIINDYHGDNKLFEDMLVEINHLVSRQEEAYKRNAERIARAYEGQQKLIEAREVVVHEINKRISGKKVPKILISLLEEGGWRQLLLVTLLREGQGSENFKESLAIVDQLMAWLGESEDDEFSVGASLEKDLEAPTLLTMIDRELRSSGQTSHLRIVNKLEEYLLKGKKPSLQALEQYEWLIDPKEFPDSVNSTEFNNQVKVGATKEKSLKTETGRWHKRAKQMVIGDWIEIIDEDGEAQRMRLAWSGSKSYRFVFVDSQGMKDIDISLDKLASRMDGGDIALLEKSDVPVVDQGLHQMVQSVYEDLASQASCDPLTGLLNRQSFERGLERAVADAMSNQTSQIVSYLDIDQFKVVNNTYGHIAGDQLLKHVASVIKNASGALATCGRLGGNEFGMIFNHCALKEGQVLSENIRKAVEETAFTWQENTLVVTVSVGVAEVDSSSDNIDTVMKKASVACNLSKEHGRNRVTVYTRQDKDQMHHDEMTSWIQKIDHSLEDLLMLRCQEIRPVNIAANRASHYEILLGVYDEDKNILPPVALIEAAEHFGRMSRIDRWVIHNTLRWMEEHAGVIEAVDGFSINLSGTSINEENFLDFVLGELSATSVPRHKICFEITETAAITNLADADDFIKVLKKTGCKFSLDDFGTGLSSYEYIQKLPVDYIKIDGVFIKNIVNNPKDQALVKSINELAHFMGMETIAEFVENTEILSMLKLLGVDNAQGYGIQRPVPLNEAFVCN